jgi:glycosyltransferase involved in cell wall biosynthesis
MIPRRIVFWEPSVSPHKLPLFRALVARGFDCTYVAQDGLSEERSALGWDLGETDALDVRVRPDTAAISDLMAQRAAESVHLFSGLRHVPVIVAGLAEAVRTGATFGLMSEPRAREGWRGALRLAQSWLTERALRRHARFVLAIGRNGPPWFRATGYPLARIFPFAYYVDAPPPLPAPAGPTTIAYLGRLEPAKGIDLFLAAAARLDPEWRIVVAGHGSAEARVRADPRVQFAGALPMAAVPGFLAEADVLVQPSLTTDDGWGAVIGEALLAGAATVASDRAGASILLDAPERGRVIRRLHPDALAAAIRDVAGTGRDAAARARRGAWARGSLTGEAGAARLVAILEHVLAAAPPPPAFPPP